MPHPILVTTAVTASALATALAVEHFVFRPWRQENWPEGFVPGMRREWEGFKEDFRQGLHDIAGGREQWPGGAGGPRRRRATSDVSQASGCVEPDAAWGQSQEVKLHEQEMELVRRRQFKEMDLVEAVEVEGGAKRQEGLLESQASEEQHVIGTPPLSPSKRHRSVATNATQDEAASVAESWDALSERRSQATSPFELPSDGGDASLFVSSSSSRDEEWERLSNSSTDEGSVVSLSRGS